MTASFNPLQPGVPQLGQLTASATTSTITSEGLILSNGFTSVSQAAIKRNGTYVPVPNAELFGTSLGSVDSNLAFNTVNTSNPSKPITNVIDLYGPISLSVKGTVSLLYPNQLSDLSESFRPDLNGSTLNGTGPALIDIQGNVQSLRDFRQWPGAQRHRLPEPDQDRANLELDDPGPAHRPRRHADAQADQHVDPVEQQTRTTGKRGGVGLVAGLTQIGPLSLTNDSPPTT